ncbi:hypothetical protein [Sphaerisporangium corydalis]|uniref:Uncharacterized protein n=1 Tax=Sphaerisporangium corydalis TaxID=1441875 RepID=A0ABV9EJ81_9ACTN|nr:hypothetical protein [Sphaerisporangium corydalis]
MDSTVWVAILTGATAVMVCGVTGYGNARAVKIQAEVAAQIAITREKREARKAAYLEFMMLADATQELYYRLDDALFPPLSEDPSNHAAHLQETRTKLRDAYEPLRRGMRMITVEGPVTVAIQAQAVMQAANLANLKLYHLASVRLDDQEARASFKEAYDAYCQRVELFTKAVSDNAYVP